MGAPWQMVQWQHKRGQAEARATLYAKCAELNANPATTQAQHQQQAHERLADATAAARQEETETRMTLVVKRTEVNVSSAAAQMQHQQAREKLDTDQ